MSLTPFLMFEGRAREAIELYTAVIPRSAVESVVHFPAEAQPEGTSGRPLIMMSVVSLDGQAVKINDTPIAHGFTFTPSTSLYFETGESAEYEAVLEGLGEGGTFLMPDGGDYGFAERFAWLNDRLGVSWQLALNPTV